MANTYTQIYIHVVFSVKYRQKHIDKSWKLGLYGYISGIIKNHEHKVLQINGMPDHIHLLISLNPKEALSDLVRIIKERSTKWINEKRLSTSKFYWQSGYGAFSITNQQVPNVVKYIQNQEEHHKEFDFQEEYINLMEQYRVEFNKDYLHSD